MRLSDLPNIGKQLEKELIAVGINTYDDLVHYGSMGTALKLMEKGDVCANKLYALEGAIRRVRWFTLPLADREALNKEFKTYMDL